MSTGDPRAPSVTLGATPAEIREIEDEYEILAELGRGGMAVVYLARDRQLGRDVAIKVIHAAAAANEAAIARLLSEARTVAQLQHPNVVAIHAVKRLSAQGLALVMQYVPGRVLERAMREDGLFSSERTESVLSDIAAALAYAHARGVVHRDVKPGNIFLNDETGRALLSDFGIALSAEMGRQQASDLIVGTPAYMSPEQIDGVALDGRSDVFSLGIVGYEMLAGQRSWIDETPSDVMYRQKFEELPPIASLRPDLDDRLVGVIDRALTKRRDDRWPSAAAFLSALTEDEWTPSARATASSSSGGSAPDTAQSVMPLPPPSTAARDGLQTRHYRRDAGGSSPAFADELPPLWSSRVERRPMTRTLAVAIPIIVVGALTAFAAFAPRDVVDRYLPMFATAPSADTTHHAAAHSPLPAAPAPTAVEILRRARDSTARASLDSVANRELALVNDSLDRADAQKNPNKNAATPSAAPPGAPGARGPTDKSSAARTPSGTPSNTTGASQSAAGTIGSAFTGAKPPGAPGAPGAAPPSTSQSPPSQTPPSAPAVPTPAAASSTLAAEPAAPALRAPIHPPSAPTIVAGGTHTCELSSDGTALCWGGNDRGQLGTGSDGRAGRPTRVAGAPSFDEISAGLTHTCGVTRTGAVYCWGANDYGQLGDSSITTRMAPAHAAFGHSYRYVAVGASHSCGLTVGGDVYCWGRNLYGQLGNGSVGDATSPVRVASGVQFVALAVGWNHSCALSLTGQAFCWGQNASGQLGDGTTIVHTAPTAVSGSDVNAFRAIAAGGSHTCALGTDGLAYCWGHNNYGQLGVGDTQEHLTPTRITSSVPFVTITAGGVHSCALTRAGEAFCWGRNSYGQLGDGTTTDHSTPVRVLGGQIFTSIHAAGSHTCARASTGGTYCWGYNSDGQLGDGTTLHHAEPTLVPAAQ